MRWLLILIGIVWVAPEASAQIFRFQAVKQLRVMQEKLQGCLLDFTYNHGVDRRLYSPSLEMKRDLYIYLPPGYDEKKCYPLLIWLHGIGQDETSFLDLAELFDAAILCGKLPPMVIAAPDGSIQGRASYRNSGSFYLNSKAGRFEDWVQIEVWNFVTEHFSIRPERGAHIIGGASMGGFGAYNHAFKHRERYATIIGILPALNLRYADCTNNYFSDFDPNCYKLQTNVQRRAPVARFYGVLVFRQRDLLDPLFGRDQISAGKVAAENPVEMLAAYRIRPGEFNMYVGYGDKDEFNIDAQAESFIYTAVRCHGLTVTGQKVINGTHDTATGKLMFPALVPWLNALVEPYAPK